MSRVRPQIVVSEVDPSWGSAEDQAHHLVLVQPEIPANTGNIARLCAATDVVLHLVKPLGFVLQDRYLKRAGLDYWPSVTLCVHDDWDSLCAIFPASRVHLMTTKATQTFTEASHEPGSVYIFGKESQGLSPAMLDVFPDKHYRVPITDKVRSLNLANTCAIVLYDVLRRQGWPNMT